MLRGVCMYERHHHAPLPLKEFLRRLVRHFLLTMTLIILSLAIGMAGYVHFENISWLDAFLNSAMLLGGMGPVNAPLTEAGKLFAGAYALYAGLVFLVVAGILAAPVVHRVLHRFHWDESVK